MADAEDSTLPLLEAATRCPSAAPAVRSRCTFTATRSGVSHAERLILTGCRACGVGGLHPLPSVGEVDVWYAGAARWEQRPGLRAQAQSVADTEGRLSASGRPSASRASARPSCCCRSSRSCQTTPAGEPLAVLDFGCGIDAWLDAIAERGLEHYGIESGPTARRGTTWPRMSVGRWTGAPVGWLPLDAVRAPGGHPARV
jgi:hypothetical protein